MEQNGPGSILVRSNITFPSKGKDIIFKKIDNIKVFMKSAKS